MLLNTIIFVLIPLYWKKQFLKNYNIDFLASKIAVKKTLKYTSDAYYTIKFPKWKKAKKDGTQDLRYKKNYIIYEKSELYIGNFILSTDNPVILINYISYLRSSGVNILLNKFEIIKRKKIIDKKKQEKSLSEINEIINVFSNNPYGFEKYCSSLYKKMGIQARTTPASNDGGYDILLNYPDGRNAVVECKCFNKNHSVGRPLIQKLVGANQIVNADEMIFITTSSFTNSAVEYAEQCNVHLVDGIDLLRLIHKYFKPDKQKITVTAEMCTLGKKDLKKYLPKDIYSIL